MRNVFLETPKHISHEWKNLRNSMTATTTDHDQLISTVKFWSMAPLLTNYLNWDDTTSWPDPWSMISNNCYDINMLALGMFHTLLLGQDQRWTVDRVKVALASDLDRSTQNLVVIADNQHVLNLQYNEIVSSEPDQFKFTIHHVYQYNDKTHVVSG